MPKDRSRWVGTGNPPTRFTTYAFIPSATLKKYRKKHRWPTPDPVGAGVHGDVLTAAHSS